MADSLPPGLSSLSYERRGEARPAFDVRLGVWGAGAVLVPLLVVILVVPRVGLVFQDFGVRLPVLTRVVIAWGRMHWALPYSVVACFIDLILVGGAFGVAGVLGTWSRGEKRARRWVVIAGIVLLAGIVLAVGVPMVSLVMAVSGSKK